MPITLEPIAHVVGGREEPRDDGWDAEQAVIELDADQFTPDALAGLSDFSHLVVVFHFDRVAPDRIETGARRPRNNPAWPRVGIFAQRGKNRPNRLGVSTCEIIAVEGLRVTVRGLDAIDGTPVLDIKPYVSAFDRVDQPIIPEWMERLMAGYF